MEADPESNSKFTPIKPHFFKPLLPGFLCDILIPVGFFNHYLNHHGKSNNSDVAVLRTVLGKWKVMIKDGRFEENGWRDFADHLHVGDMVVFRLEGGLLFDVTVFDSSACERNYDHQQTPQFLNVKQESSPQQSTDDDLQRSKEKFDNSARAPPKVAELSASLAYPCFDFTLKPYSLKEFKFFIPKAFARSLGLCNRRCEMLIIDGHNQKSWQAGLTQKLLGDNFSFELISEGTKPVMVFYAHHRSKKAMMSKGKKQRPYQASHLFTSTVTESSVKHSYLRYPNHFVRLHGLKESCQMMVKDPNGRHWIVSLNYDKLKKRSFLLRGWRVVVLGNKIKAGQDIKLELVKGGESLMMNLTLCCRSNKDTTVLVKIKEPMKLKSEALEYLHVEKEPLKMPSQASHCFMSTVTEASIKYSYLNIPSWFGRLHGFEDFGNLTIKDPRGRLWTVYLDYDKLKNSSRIKKGWKEVALANKLKQGDDIKLELLKGGDSIVTGFNVRGGSEGGKRGIRKEKPLVPCKFL